MSEESPPNQSQPPLKRKLTISQSENQIDPQKQPRQRLLCNSKSCNNKEQLQRNQVIELDLATSLSRLQVVDSQDLLINSNLTRARDSLENIQKDEQNMPRSNLDRTLIRHKVNKTPESPKSSPQIGEKSKPSSSLARSNKKCRKDQKKHAKDVNKSENNSQNSDSNSGDIEQDGEEDYQYRCVKNSKSVVFTNEVLVVYFNNEDVVGEEKEPLKKEGEQQTRNKEMRREHLNKTQEKYNLCLF